MAEPSGDSRVPVLTDVVAEVHRPRPAMDAQAVEALARELERGVLARLMPEVDRVIGHALEGVRAELTGSVTQMVREAVAASVAHALGPSESK
jgi:hypothetical protein